MQIFQLYFLQDDFGYFLDFFLYILRIILTFSIKIPARILIDILLVFNAFYHILDYLCIRNIDLYYNIYWCVLSCLNCVWLFATPWTVAHQVPLSLGYSSKNTVLGCHFLLQGIFLTQGLNPHLLYFLHWQADFLLLAPPGEPN